VRVVYLILPAVLVVAAVAVAAAPLGAPTSVSYVLQVMPYLIAHVFLVRGKGFVPSPLMFAAGLAIDIASDGPLGFWALIYLFGVLMSRQLPVGLTQTRTGRLSGLLLVVFALAAAQVGLASLYQLRWIDWHAVLVGTMGAGLIAGIVDLLWPDGRSDRSLNMTDRGAGGVGGHV